MESIKELTFNPKINHLNFNYPKFKSEANLLRIEDRMIQDHQNLFMKIHKKN